MKEDRLLTTKETASYLGVHFTTLQRWRIQGGGPDYIRLSKTYVKYRQSDIDNWLDKFKNS